MIPTLVFVCAQVLALVLWPTTLGWVLYPVSALGIATALTQHLRSKGHTARLAWYWGFGLVLSGLLPVVGPLFILLPLQHALLAGEPKKAQWFGLMEPVHVPKPRATRAVSDMTLSSVAQILRSRAPVDRRFRAVLATRSFSPREAVGLLRLALLDSAEEVRLLAHSRLGGLRAGIERRIQMRRHWIEEGMSRGALGEVHQRLAEDYWELCYLELVDGEALLATLAKAAEAASLALAHDVARPHVALLLGRIELRRGNIGLADDFLQMSEEFGMPAHKVAPYRAEVAFRKGGRHEVSPMLARGEIVVGDRNRFSKLIEFWT